MGYKLNAESIKENLVAERFINYQLKLNTK